MLHMRLSNLVNDIVRQELQGKGRENEALYFNFDVRLSYYTNSTSLNESTGLHLLYHCRPESTYINVFSAVTENCFAGIHEVKEWNHEVSHDSCWREIRAFFELHMLMADRINFRLEKVTRVWDENNVTAERVAPIEMSQHICFNNKVFEWVPVEVKKDPSCDRSYRKLVTVKPEAKDPGSDLDPEIKQEITKARRGKRQ